MKPYPKYKDSGIEWIGEIPENWIATKIKYNTYVKGRIGWQGLTTNEYIDEGPFLVTGTDFHNGKIEWSTCCHISEDRYKQDLYIQLEENDLLITKDGTIGKVALVKCLEGKATLNSGVFVTRPLNGKYLTEFMYWILNSKVFSEYIEYIKTGTTISHLYQNTFVEFSFSLSSQSEQSQISNYLDHKTKLIDTLIDKKQKQIELLKEQRTAIINQAVTKGLDPNVKMKDSGIEWLGDIPEHWEVVRVKHVFKNLDHKRVPLSSEIRATLEKIYPYYGASGIIDQVNDYLFDEPLILVAEDGANLLSRSTPLAFIARGKYWVNNHAHILKPLYGDIVYWEGVLQAYDYTPLVTGAAQPKLTAGKIGSIPLPSPPNDEQKRISSHLDQKTKLIDTLIGKKRKYLELIKEHRTTLISEAVTGKIDVRNEVIQ